MILPPFSGRSADFSARAAADAYASLTRPDTSGLRENAPAWRREAFTATERHLQAVWSDPRWRPAGFPLVSGEQVRVLDPGTWNLGAGPDFLDAELLIEPGTRRLRGDVEIHIRTADWTAHHHGNDPAYARVIAHVTWFPGPRPDTLPAGALCLSLQPELAHRPDLLVDEIDLASYPHAVFPETPRPCALALKNRPDTAAAILAAAGSHRLRIKADRMRRLLDEGRPPAHVLYESCLAVLGYSRHTAAFRALGRTIPPAPDESRDALYARLLGAVGLLPQPDTCPDPETARAVRKLWDLWWRSGAEPVAEPLQTVGAVRPQNTPARRLAAAAALFADPGDLPTAIEALPRDTEVWYKQVADLLRRRAAWPFWEVRLTFAGPPGPACALLGDGRIGALITNALVPFFLAQNTFPEALIARLPPETESAPQRETAFLLLGRDHNPACYARAGLLQQGLLQIGRDFCHSGPAACAACRLAAWCEKN